MNIDMNIDLHHPENNKLFILFPEDREPRLIIASSIEDASQQWMRASMAHDPSLDGASVSVEIGEVDALLGDPEVELISRIPMPEALAKKILFGSLALARVPDLMQQLISAFGRERLARIEAQKTSLRLQAELDPAKRAASAALEIVESEITWWKDRRDQARLCWDEAMVAIASSKLAASEDILRRMKEAATRAEEARPVEVAGEHGEAPAAAAVVVKDDPSSEDDALPWDDEDQALADFDDPLCDATRLERLLEDAEDEDEPKG